MARYVTDYDPCAFWWGTPPIFEKPGFLSQKNAFTLRRLARDAVRELPHEFEQALGLLDLRDVTCLWDEFEASVGQRLGVGTAIVRVHDAITLSPDDECRNPHATKSAAQLGIAHTRLSPVDPSAWKFAAIAATRSGLRVAGSMRKAAGL
jgi:hypothetical protein